MAEKIVSPGVFTKENDLSFLSQGVAAIGTAFVGPFKEGPLVPTVVNTQTEFEQLYGTVDDTYYTAIAVTKYLKEAGQAVVARVTGYGGYTEPEAYGFVMNNKALAILFSARTDASSSFTNASFIEASPLTYGSGSFFLSSSLIKPYITASLLPSKPFNIGATYSTDPKTTKPAYVVGYFSSAATSEGTGSAVTPISASNQSFPDEATEARTPYIISQDIGGQRYNLFRFETIGGGDASNQKVKIGITNIKPAGEGVGTDYATFTVVVRDFNDTNKRKSALESYSNVTLDPNSVNYIYRVIGDRKITFNAEGKVTETGDWANRSKYIRMVNFTTDSSLSPENIPLDCAPVGHAAYYTPVYTTGSDGFAYKIPAVSYNTATATTYGGIKLDETNDNKIYLRAYAVSPDSVAPNWVGASGSNVPYSLDGTDGYSITGSAASAVAVRNFLVAFQGGFDGQRPTISINKGTAITATNTQGFDCSTTTASGSISYAKAIAALSNAEEFDIQLLVTPGIVRQLHEPVVTNALDMVTERGDCFYIFDGTKVDATIADARDQAKAVDSNYAAMYYPWVKTTDPITGKLITIPPSTLMPATYAANDRVSAEWFAPAGLNRGGLSGAVAVLEKLNQADRDNLYEDKVNPIIQFPGQGIVAFGQKTLQAKPSALDRINVRRLLLTVRKYIASASRYLVFEQNTPATRGRFLSIVNPYLDQIKQRQGLYAFKVIMDDTNNTPDMIDRNLLKGAVYLQPTKTAEFIQIDFNILPTGASFGG